MITFEVDNGNESVVKSLRCFNDKSERSFHENKGFGCSLRTQKKLNHNTSQTLFFCVKLRNLVERSRRCRAGSVNVTITVKQKIDSRRGKISTFFAKTIKVKTLIFKLNYSLGDGLFLLKFSPFLPLLCASISLNSLSLQVSRRVKASKRKYENFVIRKNFNGENFFFHPIAEEDEK